jgi:hypothetical protein
MECGRSWTLTFTYCPVDAGWLVLEEKPPVPVEDVPYMHMRKDLKVITPDHGVRTVRETDPKGTFYFFDDDGKVCRIWWHAAEWRVDPHEKAPDMANVIVVHAHPRAANL